MSDVELPESIEGVLEVEVLRGAQAPADAAPSLLVEVPHGADEQRHYDALRGRLVGDLPARLERFFHVNTDVAAWAYGRAAAERVLATEPTRSALLLRCCLPRTFVDCNRPADFGGGDLTEGGLTAGIPAYVRDERDEALLLELHRTYVRAAEQAFAAVCGRGGVALVPHTYAPRSVGIQTVGDDIVEELDRVYQPELYATWPLRAEVDLLTREEDGTLLAPAGAEQSLLAGCAGLGLEAKANETYYLHPASLAHGWSRAHPGRVLCLEVRRDLLVEDWIPFVENRADPAKVAPLAGVLATTLLEALRGAAAAG